VILGIILGRLPGNIDRFTKQLLEGIVKINDLVYLILSIVGYFSIKISFIYYANEWCPGFAYNIMS